MFTLTLERMQETANISNLNSVLTLRVVRFPLSDYLELFRFIVAK